MFNEFVSYGFGFFSQSAQSMKLGLRLCGVTSSAGHTAEAGRTQRIPFPCSSLPVQGDALMKQESPFSLGRRNATRKHLFAPIFLPLLDFASGEGRRR